MSPVISTHNVSITKNNSISSSSSNNNMMEERYYESIIFSGPILFTLIILFLFYFFYLRRHSVDWSSLRMRQSRINSASASAAAAAAEDLVNEVGLKKEFRELLPVIIYKESFTVKDTQCSVCLGDYQAEDRLQQIPGCCHTFHLNCIDLWLATHTTCPLCRLSLVTSSKDPPNLHPNNPSDNDSGVDSLHSIDSVLNSDNPSDNGSRVERVHSFDGVLNPNNPLSDNGSRVDSVHSVDCVHLQSRLQVS